jgi:hypothetical protein
MPGPDRQFWQDKFTQGSTPWDRGGPNPQLDAWLADGSLAPSAGAIAVPGCGSGHEVLTLARCGFEVLAVDYASAACEATRARLESGGATGAAQVICADVLEWNPGRPLGAIYEQTCLCALHPDHWVCYAAALHAWLGPGGRLWLLAMQAARPRAAEGFIEGPPYHVDINALRALFDGDHWEWPKPPYAQVPHPNGSFELGLVLTRR